MGESHLILELVGWIGPPFLAGASLTPSPNLPPSTMSSSTPEQRWVCPALARGGSGAAGRMGVQVRKQGSHCLPLRAKDSERVNIYYLPDGSEARLGLPPQGSQMGMEGRKCLGWWGGVRGFCSTWYPAWDHAAGLLPASS